jgi:predicted thioesterase
MSTLALKLIVEIMHSLALFIMQKYLQNGKGVVQTQSC